jgi:hypothetical protein
MIEAHHAPAASAECVGEVVRTLDASQLLTETQDDHECRIVLAPAIIDHQLQVMHASRPNSRA